VNVVLDTNIWISFLIGQSLDNMEDRFLQNDIHVLTSEDQLHEVRDVIARPKFARYFSVVEQERLEDFLFRTALPVTPSERIELCRDPKDDFLLELAVAGEADYLVTGDEDLLVLGAIRQTRIIRLAEFCELLTNGLNS
jgi:putative toxin-antitoxin system toxin component, PIN family